MELKFADIRKIQEIEKTLKGSDRDLYEWFKEHLNNRELSGIYSILLPKLNNSVVTDHFNKLIRAKDWELSDAEYNYMSLLLVHELKEYSGHTFNFFKDKPDYNKTLQKVHERYAKRFKKSCATVASSKQREDDIANWLTAYAVDQLSSDEVSDAMEAANLKPTKEMTTENFKTMLREGGLTLVYHTVGKKVIKELVLQVLKASLKAVVTEKVAAETVKAVGKKVAQYHFKAFLGYITVALVVKDIVDIGGEATRITTPLVTSIAIQRSLFNILNEKKEKAINE